MKNTFKPLTPEKRGYLCPSVKFSRLHWTEKNELAESLSLLTLLPPTVRPRQPSRRPTAAAPPPLYRRTTVATRTQPSFLLSLITTPVLPSHHIQGYPSIRIFRKGSDIRDDHGDHDHESYYGDRDTDSLVKTMEKLVASLPAESQKLGLEDKSNGTEYRSRCAPLAGGCRIEGYVRVKKVPGDLVISARSDAHSFDASQMNMSHVVHHLSFGRKLSPRVLSDVKRLIPYVGSSHERLNGPFFLYWTTTLILLI
ncbi:protein disulfide-isomerase 5-3-like [Arachis ipaensis]|uniref:protein disulfide-isomerase 5-3-like n=1 Tax=Arachis ipaensis TaxID=130454 RepID=UPI0007AF4951|nr:protein disulfide-isomerase 5-3-like [Arachis ipaensis]